MGQWTDWQTDNKYEIILKYCTKIPEMSIENLKKIAPLELDIIISVRKWGNEQTKRHTRNLKSFWSNVQKIPEMSPENLKKISHPELDISKDNLISVRNWGNEQTDRHTRNLKLF